MATKEEKKTEVGIIGQMYEDRKSKKVGVLESRDEKFKTLMMRDKDGNSFNIQYSTFRSGWRKYQGDEVIQTSTQVEEKKAEEIKEVSDAKEVVEKQTKTVKFTTEDKVKAVRAITTLVENRIKEKGSLLKTSRKAQGGIVIRLGKYTIFELWIKYGMNKYDVFYRGHIIDALSKADKKALESIDTVAVVDVHNNWPLKYQYRFDESNFEQVIDAFIELGDNYAKEKEDKKVKNDEKTEEK